MEGNLEEVRHSKPRMKEMNSMNRYERLQKLGQGTFGVVQKAKDRKTGSIVALKQLLNHSAKEGFPITAMREITILKQLKNKHILELIDMVYEAPKVSNPKDLVHQRGCFYTVSSYMTSDLVGLLRNPSVRLTVPHIKCLMQQLLQGVQYIHEQKFLHRDIKAANILVGNDGILKIADFGLARVYHGKKPCLGQGPGGGERPYTGLVVTRWYRPPEILLGDRKYTTAVDLWGVGCVFAELFTKRPILVGKTDSHQAQLIFELCGAPDVITWPEAVNLPNKSDFSIGITCKRSLETRFKPLISDDGIDLLSGLLKLDPLKRFNALDALAHEYFDNDPKPVLPSQLPKFEESHEIDAEKYKLMQNRAPPVGINQLDTQPQPLKSHQNLPRPSYDNKEASINKNKSIDNSTWGAKRKETSDELRSQETKKAERQAMASGLFMKKPPAKKRRM